MGMAAAQASPGSFFSGIVIHHGNLVVVHLSLVGTPRLVADGTKEGRREEGGVPLRLPTGVGVGKARMPADALEMAR